MKKCKSYQVNMIILWVVFPFLTFGLLPQNYRVITPPTPNPLSSALMDFHCKVFPQLINNTLTLGN